MGDATILNCRYDEGVFPSKSELADEEIKATVVQEKLISKERVSLKFIEQR